MTDTPGGLLRQMADHVDAYEYWPLGVAVVVAYPDGTADVGYEASDLLALVSAVTELTEELAEHLKASAS